jgi:hypothetical protein
MERASPVPRAIAPLVLAITVAIATPTGIEAQLVASVSGRVVGADTSASSCTLPTVA